MIFEGGEYTSNKTVAFKALSRGFYVKIQNVTDWQELRGVIKSIPRDKRNFNGPEEWWTLNHTHDKGAFKDYAE